MAGNPPMKLERPWKRKKAPRIAVPADATMLLSFLPRYPPKHIPTMARIILTMFGIAEIGEVKTTTRIAPTTAPMTMMNQFLRNFQTRNEAIAPTITAATATPITTPMLPLSIVSITPKLAAKPKIKPAVITPAKMVAANVTDFPPMKVRMRPPTISMAPENLTRGARRATKS